MDDDCAYSYGHTYIKAGNYFPMAVQYAYMMWRSIHGGDLLLLLLLLLLLFPPVINKSRSWMLIHKPPNRHTHFHATIGIRHNSFAPWSRKDPIAIALWGLKRCMACRMHANTGVDARATIERMYAIIVMGRYACIFQWVASWPGALIVGIVLVNILLNVSESKRQLLLVQHHTLFGSGYRKKLKRKKKDWEE